MVKLYVKCERCNKYEPAAMATLFSVNDVTSDELDRLPVGYKTHNLHLDCMRGDHVLCFECWEEVSKMLIKKPDPVDSVA